MKAPSPSTLGLCQVDIKLSSTVVIIIPYTLEGFKKRLGTSKNNMENVLKAKKAYLHL